ncbi:HAMP domain-containing protein [Streptomyces sp. RKND-216]|nr:HAMP domain-containing protein [Streptomyces sp. RKND-216]
MPGLSSRPTAHRAVHGKSLTHSLVLLTVTPVIVLVGLWAFAATALVVERQTEENPARADELVMWVAIGSIVAGAVLITTCLLVWRYSRGLTGRLHRLHQETVELAGTGLPQLVRQLTTGDKKLPEEPAPDRSHGDDEVGAMAYALHQLRKSVGDTLAEQARGREGSEQVFLGLARRTQVLISRLIPKLDELERKHHDSDLLKDIFAVDHLATRVRRHTENLVILGGAPPVRRWSRAVPIYEVLRSAISETEDYRRVDAQPAPQVSLVGPAVADVVHLLAELIENGTAFSPPETKVSVSASHVANGLALEVEDRGLGMPEAKYAHINRLLSEPPRLDMMSLGETPRLGLFVVARLARRHHLEVSLRRSHYGGTLAIVLLPHELLEETKSLLSSIVDRRQESADRPMPAGAGLLGASSSVSETTLPAEPAAASVLPAAASAPAFPAPAAAASAGPAPAGAGSGSGMTMAAVASASDDSDGFPSYGGAGLLPSTDEPAADAGISEAAARSEQPPAADPAPAPHAPAPAASYGSGPSLEPAYARTAGHTPGLPSGQGPEQGRDRAYGGGYGHGSARMSGGAGLYPGPEDGPGHGPGAAPEYGRDHGRGPDHGSGTSAAPPPPPLPQRTSAPSAQRVPEPSAASADSPPGPDGIAMPKTLPTRVRGENLAAPLRRSPNESPESAGPPSPDRAGAAIGAIQSANRRARNTRPVPPPPPPSPASSSTPSTPAPPAGGHEAPMDRPEYGTGSQES